MEVIPDAGDLNMYEVAKALYDIGYEGCIDYDHIMRLSTDGPAGREYIAYCVGHMRGIHPVIGGGPQVGLIRV